MAQQFLDDFDSKMNRLVDIRRNLQNSVQFKQQFTNVYIIHPVVDKYLKKAFSHMPDNHRYI